jgi:hypothetical protein
MKPAAGLVLLAPLPFVVNAAAVDPAAFEVRAVDPRDANPTPAEDLAERQEPSRTLEGETTTSPPAPTRTLEGTTTYCTIL